ncbi:MAG: hypothetical protein JSV00_07970 [bacterium]|nr:MAG: hypothetical protein JSV00_07970 [bacterium]
MNRAMDDLEKAVSRLLERLQGSPSPAPSVDESARGLERLRGTDASREEEAGYREAAELVRRAIKRLKSL